MKKYLVMLLVIMSSVAGRETEKIEVLFIRDLSPNVRLLSTKDRADINSLINKELNLHPSLLYQLTEYLNAKLNDAERDTINDLYKKLSESEKVLRQKKNDWIHEQISAMKANSDFPYQIRRSAISHLERYLVSVSATARNVNYLDTTYDAKNREDYFTVKYLSADTSLSYNPTISYNLILVGTINEKLAQIEKDVQSIPNNDFNYFNEILVQIVNLWYIFESNSTNTPFVRNLIHSLVDRTFTNGNGKGLKVALSYNAFNTSLDFKNTIQAPGIKKKVSFETNQNMPQNSMSFSITSPYRNIESPFRA